jgi:hypothetical protein
MFDYQKVSELEYELSIKHVCVCVDCGDGGVYQISEGRILKFELKKKHDLIRWWVRKMG